MKTFSIRFLLTILIVSFLYALFGAFDSISIRSVGDFFASFFLTFGFISLAVFFAACVFYYLLYLCKWQKWPLPLPFQIAILSAIYLSFLTILQMPDYYRHQNTPGYEKYNSISVYFIENMLEGFINAVIFAVAIPTVDWLVRKRLNAKM